MACCPVRGSGRAPRAAAMASVPRPSFIAIAAPARAAELRGGVQQRRVPARLAPGRVPLLARRGGGSSTAAGGVTPRGPHPDGAPAAPEATSAWRSCPVRRRPPRSSVASAARPPARSSSPRGGRRLRASASTRAVPSAGAAISAPPSAHAACLTAWCKDSTALIATRAHVSAAGPV